VSSDVMRSVSPTGSQRSGIRDERLPPLPTESVRLVDLAAVSVAQIGAMIDETLCGPELQPEDVVRGCRRSVELGLAAVVCRPRDVELAAQVVSGSVVKVATTVGLALDEGTSLPEILREAERVLELGAREVGLVWRAQQLNCWGQRLLAAQVAAVATVAAPLGAVVKVVVTTSRRPREGLLSGCRTWSTQGPRCCRRETATPATAPPCRRSA